VVERSSRRPGRDEEEQHGRGDLKRGADTEYLNVLPFFRHSICIHAIPILLEFVLDFAFYTNFAIVYWYIWYSLVFSELVHGNIKSTIQQETGFFLLYLQMHGWILSVW
jgi:hypothetical protein